MKIALVQTAIVPLCPAANMLQAEQLMNTMPDADVYVLPETWSTGFCTEPDTPYPDADEALRWMKNQLPCARRLWWDRLWSMPPTD